MATGAAGNTGTQGGDITISVFSSPPVNATTGSSLTFIADGSIEISGNFSFSSGAYALPLTFLAGRSGQGGIRLPNTTIDHQNGDITFGGFTTYNRAGGGTFIDAPNILHARIFAEPKSDGSLSLHRSRTNRVASNR